MKIEEEIQTKGFSTSQQKAVINVLFTAGWLNGLLSQWLKPFDISHPQYNILRILRGQTEAISIIDIKCRMLDRMSNVSRLVEKLRLKGYVQRLESSQDRRLVEIKLTQEGRTFLDQVTAAIPAALHSQSQLSQTEAELLSDLLDKMRETP